MIKKVIVLGGGSAGFIAAIALKNLFKELQVTVIHSPEIGIIGVGEGSTVAVANFLHKDVNVHPGDFFSTVRPTFKLGLRFIWGPRSYFQYTFGPGMDRQTPGLAKPVGFYCDEDMSFSDAYCGIMDLDRCFERSPAGGPRLHTATSYHFENKKFVTFLEMHARKLGTQIVEDTVQEVRQNEHGIESLRLSSGSLAEADLFVDCSGFASVLLGKSLLEPFESFDQSLFCDRAVVGGWKRTEEIIKPYTTCQTMSAGWCWQIEHEERINRGYVHSSAFISDADAEREFRAANPRVSDTRVVKFISGIYRNAWVKNVVAIGNSSGFVEPLEATSLGMICTHSKALANALRVTDCQPPDAARRQYNDLHRRGWHSIRDFLAVHYKFNTRVDSAFWQYCREKTELAGAAPIVENYQAMGPTSLWEENLFDPIDQFKNRGYATLLIGQRVPYERRSEPSARERAMWEAEKQGYRALAQKAMTVREVLDAIHAPQWRWVTQPRIA